MKIVGDTLFYRIEREIVHLLEDFPTYSVWWLQEPHSLTINQQYFWVFERKRFIINLHEKEKEIEILIIRDDWRQYNKTLLNCLGEILKKEGFNVTARFKGDC